MDDHSINHSGSYMYMYKKIAIYLNNSICIKHAYNAPTINKRYVVIIFTIKTKKIQYINNET